MNAMGVASAKMSHHRAGMILELAFLSAGPQPNGGRPVGKQP